MRQRPNARLHATTALLCAFILSFSVPHSSIGQTTNEVTTLNELMNTPTDMPGVATPPESGTLVQWFGHAFVYLTASSGIRIAINPFSDGVVDYEFPASLPADIVLISCESPDHSGGKELFGLPQVFRSLAGEGLNNANGITFRGSPSFRDDQGGRQLGRNTIYSFTLDGVRYCHPGALGHSLDFRTRSQIGKVDVLFLPVGNRLLSNNQLWELAQSLKARWIVPITYQTPKSRRLELRSLDEFEKRDIPVRDVGTPEFIFQAETLPEVPTLLLLKSP